MTEHQDETLKGQALLERIGELTVQYEGKIADLRVQFTRAINERDALVEEKVILESQIDALRTELEAVQSSSNED